MNFEKDFNSLPPVIQFLILFSVLFICTLLVQGWSVESSQEIYSLNEQDDCEEVLFVNDVYILKTDFTSQYLAVDGQLTEKQEIFLENSMPVKGLLRYHPEELTAWNRFRREAFLVADSLHREFKDDLAMSSIDLYQWLMRTMHAESKYNPKAMNSRSSATGLIQLMKSRYADYGFTSRGDILKYNQLEQLWKMVYPWYERKFQGLKNAKRLNTIDEFLDVYLLVFLPAYADNPGRGVIYSRSRSPNTYRRNSGYDWNKDGKVTKDEIGKRIMSKFQQNKYTFDTDGVPHPIPGRSGGLYTSYALFEGVKGVLAYNK